MVDALEENVMKDILSIGLQKRKRNHQPKKHQKSPKPSKYSQYQENKFTEFGHWLGWVTSHLAQHKWSADAPTSAKRSQNIVLALSYSDVLTHQRAAAILERLRDTVYERFFW